MRKRAILILLSLLLLAGCFGCGKRGDPRVDEKALAAARVAYVESLIEEIGEVGYASLAAINRAENFYRVLTDEQKALVTNAGILTAARERYNELTSVPKLGSDRLDRSKLLCGAYYYSQVLWNDEDMQKLVDVGADFIINGSNSTKLLDLCEKYGVKVVVSGLPSWGSWGSEMRKYENADKMSELVPISLYEQKAAAFVDHPAIFSLSIVDEPYCESFPYLGEVTSRFKAEFFPGKLPYINLNPWDPAPNRRPYRDYISAFAEYVDVDYICYDYYMYDWGFSGACLNAATVSDICRDTGRDFWLILQANTSKGGEPITEAKLSMQAYTSLAYGAKALQWACYSAGWWEFNIVDAEGNYNMTTYNALKNLNAELGKFSDVYMQYARVATYAVGEGASGYFSEIGNMDIKARKQDAFTEICVSDGGGVLAGYFEKPDGSGYGLMISNASELKFGSVTNTVSFKAPCATKVTAYIDGVATALTPDENGVYSLSARSCDGVFVTMERDEKAFFESLNLIPSKAEYAFDKASLELGAYFGGVMLSEARIAELAGLGVSLIAGNANADILAALEKHSMGIFALNRDYIAFASPAYFGPALLELPSLAAFKDICASAEENGTVLSKIPAASTSLKAYTAITPFGFFAIDSAFDMLDGSEYVSYFTDLKNAAKAAADNGLCFYTVVNTSALSPLYALPSPDRLAFEIYCSLAFGARKVFISDGTYLENADNAEAFKKVYENISAFKGAYEQSRLLFAGSLSSESAYTALGRVTLDADEIEKVGFVSALASDGPALAGFFERGEGGALMLVSCGVEEACTVSLMLDGSQKKVTLYQNGKATALKGSGNTYTVTLTTCEGVFVTIE